MKDNSAPSSAPNSAPTSAPTPTTAGNALATEQAPPISAVSSEAIIPALTPQIPSTQQIPSATASAAPSAPLPTEELIDIEHFAKVQLRVGQVVAAEKVEKSKKLLKLQVNLGNDLGTRQILSGISQFYAPEQLLGKKIVVVANLKPAMMMGLESRGMLLASSSADRSQLQLVNPGDDAVVGSAVS